MERTSKEIIASIRALLDELEGVKNSAGHVVVSAPKIIKKLSGCSGAIQELIGEGFFGQPKDVMEVLKKLKEEGRSSDTYALASMNLLGLVKRKTLRRINQGGWKYVVRT